MSTLILRKTEMHLTSILNLYLYLFISFLYLNIKTKAEWESLRFSLRARDTSGQFLMNSCAVLILRWRNNTRFFRYCNWSCTWLVIHMARWSIFDQSTKQHGGARPWKYPAFQIYRIYIPHTHAHVRINNWINYSPF